MKIFNIKRNLTSEMTEEGAHNYDSIFTLTSILNQIFKNGIKIFSFCKSRKKFLIKRNIITELVTMSHPITYTVLLINL